MPNPSQSTLVIVSGALFSAEGKLLLLRRKETDVWEFPGGLLEFGEAPELGLVRTFREATDMDIAVDTPLGAWSTVENGAGPEEKKHLVHIAFVVRLSGTLLNVELDRAAHEGFAWLTRGEALQRAGFSSFRAAVERAFTTLARTRGSRFTTEAQRHREGTEN